MEDNVVVFAEYYRPKTIDDCILPEQTKQMVRDSIKSGNVPHFLFAGAAGTGKTSLGRAIANELDADLLYINASLETSIDVIRSKVVSYSSSVSFSGNLKIILMDECLSEHEEVRIGTVDSWVPVKLSDLKRDTLYQVVSFNEVTRELENDVGYVISDREDELFEVELSDGSKITANSKHPFMCLDSTGKVVQRTISDGFDGVEVLKF